ncbi:FimV family protein [Pseudomonas sp. NFX15]|uniref:type IV pilus assembly protein FimV n=1 Tax=Pseudomonas sp. NFX15 TaxID=2816958 RepID=UPI003B8E5389
MLKCWRLDLRGCSQWLLAAAVVIYSAWAAALGLGEITLHSALDQPLRADIALVDAAGLEEGDLSVSLATADEFNRAGVERVGFLNNLTFTPVLRGNRTSIQVTSSKPVREPFLNFLVQLNQPNGRLLREYTVLIDPPGSPGIVPVTDEPLSVTPESAFPATQPVELPSPVAEATPDVDIRMDDPADEPLTASAVQDPSLQSAVDELNAKLRHQNELIADQKKQLAELRTQLVELQKVKALPNEPAAVVPEPTIAPAPGFDWPLIAGLPTLLSMLALGWFVRYRRQHQATASLSQPTQSGPLTAITEPVTWSPVMHPSAPVVVAEAVAPGLGVPREPATDDEYRLNLDELSTASNWDVILPDANNQHAELAMIEPTFELETPPVLPSRQPSPGLS